MSTIAPVPAASLEQTVVQTGGSSNAQTDYDTFLTLLVTQLKNQDPTEPTDHAELLSQLASFSAVEQQTQTNDKLDQLMAAMSLDQASSLIGKHMESADGATQGIISSITLNGSETLITLQNGEQMTLTDGVTISNPDQI